MADKPFNLPDIGEGTAEAELVAWHVAPGDRIEEDQPLCDVMTDKATVEVTSPFAGVIAQQFGFPGDMLAVGSVILVIETADLVAADAPDPPVAPERTDDLVSTRPPISESVRVQASPAVRGRARDLGVDLTMVRGSGPRGRVRHTDLEAYLAYTSDAVRAPAPAPQSEPTMSLAATSGEEIESVPVIGLRRRIAERMQDTKRRIPHFSYIEEIDVTGLEALRAELNAGSDPERLRLSLLPFLIRAMVVALRDFPQLNAVYDDVAGVVHRHRSVHVGIATQTPSGLVVTTVRHAETRDLWAVAHELTRLSSAAKAGRAVSSDLTGSTITITSLGALGGVATTPVINSPEVSIIGVNKMVERPVVRQGRIEVAKMMNLSSSFDHRIVDGWDAASFIQRVRSLLEAPARMFLE